MSPGDRPLLPRLLLPPGGGSLRRLTASGAMRSCLCFLMSHFLLVVAALEVDLSACNPAQVSSFNLGAPCLGSFLSAGVCPAECCCVQVRPDVMWFAQGSSCYLEYHVGGNDSDGPAFRVSPAAPVSPQLCGDLNTTACGSGCGVIGGVNEVVASAKPAPATGDSNSTQAGAAISDTQAEPDRNRVSGSDGSSSSKTALYCGLGALGFAAICAFVATSLFLARRRKAAKAGLQPPPSVDGDS
jgi:hypothetical protein